MEIRNQISRTGLCVRSIVLLALCAVAWQVGLPSVNAENWPHWRGPQFNGCSSETNVPTSWSKDKNIRWRLPLPGPAGSTPVVWGDKIFLTTPSEKQLELRCISTDGEELWKRTITTTNKTARSDEGNYASPSPVVNKKFVCAVMGDGSVACFDHDGREAWKLDLSERYVELDIQFGYASTPILYEGKLYMQIVHGEGKAETHEARVVCVDIATGNDVWVQKRITGAKMECEHSYASPVLYRDAERSFLITHGADYSIAHALDDGHELWRMGGMNSHGRYHATLRLVASPAVGPGIIVIPSAKRGPISAILPDGSGDVSSDKSKLLWRLPKATPDVPSPLVYDGLVYIYSETGRLTCVDAKTGEEYYKERTVSGRHRASPMVAGGNIYLAARNGVVTVVKAGQEFEVVAQNDLDESLSASPIVANGVLYLRTFDALYAIVED